MTTFSGPSTQGERRFSIQRLREILTTLRLIGLARLVDRTGRRLFIAAVVLLRQLARFPLAARALDPLLDRIDHGDRLHFELAEALRVCSALNQQNVPYWVTGGWGLDVLAGCETRRHGDLDFALKDFHENLPATVSILADLGYERQKPLGGTFWFPDAEVYEDRRGHHIEILNMNWELLRAAEALIDVTRSSVSESSEDARDATENLLERCTTTGIIEGVSIPALSLLAQKLFHSGYRDRRMEDTHADDLIKVLSQTEDWIDPLSSTTPRGHHHHVPSTLLLVPNFSFPPDLWRLCRIYHNNLNLIPPHVTLAYPFLPLASITNEIVQHLAKLFADVSAFDFELVDVTWFGTNVVYLEPSKSEIFRSITETLQLAYPEFHPYDDQFESVIPHVCLSEHGSLADRKVIARHAPKYLPIPARATHVWMMSNQRRSDEWAIVKIFPLGTEPTP